MSELETWTEIEIEASLCLWEAFIEDKGPAVQALRESFGSVTSRHDCIHAAKPFLAIYDTLTTDDPDLFDLWSYDWEVVPAFLIAACHFTPAYVNKVEYALTHAFTRHGKEIGERALRILRDEPELETTCECGKTLEVCQKEPCTT